MESRVRASRARLSHPVLMMVVSTLACNSATTGGALTLLSPDDGQVLAGSREIVLRVPGASGAVQLQVDGAVVATLDGPEYRYVLDPGALGLESGEHVISAVARDASSAAAQVRVVVDVPEGFAVAQVIPEQAAPGSLLTIHGNGFGPSSEVLVGGRPAKVVARTTTTLLVQVPRSAQAGQGQVVVQEGRLSRARGLSVLTPRRPWLQPARLPAGTGPALAIKLRAGSRLYERDGVLISGSIADAGGLSRLIASAGGARLLGAQAAQRQAWRAVKRRNEAMSGAELIDPAEIFEVRLAAGVDAQRAADLIASHPLVEVVHGLAWYHETPAGDLPPVATCSLAAAQDHLEDSNYTVATDQYDSTRRGGLGLPYAWSIGSTRGLYSTIVHAEYGWEIEHEDLPVVQYLNTPASTPPAAEWLAHGTAVAGLLVAEDDGYRTSGIVPEAVLLLYDRGSESARRDGCSLLSQIASEVPPGSVILITMQLTRQDPSGSTTLLETPWEDPAVEPTLAECIRLWTLEGYIIVEAAGNGGLDLDTYAAFAPATGGGRNPSWSGAIMVGAAEGWEHGRYSSGGSPGVGSNYGARVDLHGWGEGVVSTGGCDLASVTGGIDWCASPAPLEDYFDASTCGTNLDPRQGYTGRFSGTSAAAAQVAGAVAALQSFALEQNAANPYLGSESCDNPNTCSTAAKLRDRLEEAGTPQKPPVTEPVGPMPDLGRAVCDAVEGEVCGSEECSVAGYEGTGTRDLYWQSCQCRPSAEPCCPPAGTVCTPNGYTCSDGSKLDLCWKSNCTCGDRCGGTCSPEPPACDADAVCNPAGPCCDYVGQCCSKRKAYLYGENCTCTDLSGCVYPGGEGCDY